MSIHLPAYNNFRTTEKISPQIDRWGCFTTFCSLFIILVTIKENRYVTHIDTYIWFCMHPIHLIFIGVTNYLHKNWRTCPTSLIVFDIMRWSWQNPYTIHLSPNLLKSCKLQFYISNIQICIYSIYHLNLFYLFYRGRKLHNICTASTLPTWTMLVQAILH
jgi:hypothetical protein